MGAELLLVGKETGLVELAHHLAQLEQHGHVAPVGAEVALWRCMLREGGLGRGRAQVQHQVEALLLRAGLAAEVDGAGHLAGTHASAVGIAGRQVHLVVQADGVLGAGHDAGIAARAQVQVDGVVGGPLHVEGPEPARQAGEAPAEHGKAPGLGPARLARALREQGHVEHVGHQGGGLFGGIERADDQQAPGALVADGGHRRRLGQAGGGQQGGDLGAGITGIAAPAASFADVHEADRRHRAFGLRAEFTEQALLLGAGDHDFLAGADGILEGSGLAPAKRGMEGQFLMQGRAQRLRVEGHRLVAVADQRGHVRYGWLPWPHRPLRGRLWPVLAS